MAATARSRKRLVKHLRRMDAPAYDSNDLWPAAGMTQPQSRSPQGPPSTRINCEFFNTFTALPYIRVYGGTPGSTAV